MENIKLRHLVNRTKTFEEEVEIFESMTSEQIRDVYNVDYREEAIAYIRDWWGVKYIN